MLNSFLFSYFVRFTFVGKRGKSCMNFFYKIILFAVLITIVIGKTYAQQDPQFNMGFTNPTFVNPGYAGNNEDDMFLASAFNRLELAGFEGRPVTTVINVQGPIDIFGVRSGISATIQNEIIGNLRAPGLNLGYAYRYSLGENKGEIGIGVSLGFISSWYVSNEWRTPDGGSDVVIPTQENAGIAFDAGAGVFYSNSRWFGGVSVTHLTSPSLGIDKNARYKPTLYLTGGYSFMLDSAKWVLKPMVNVISDLAQTSYNIACNVVYEKKYWGGINYRWEQAVAAMVGMELFEGIKIGYSYEYATSSLSRFSGGTHEIMLSYSFSVKTPRGIQRYKSVRYL